MARPKKQKGPGQGRPGIARKYAKPKAGDGPKPVTHTTTAANQEPQDPEIDFSAALQHLDSPPHPQTPESPLVDINIYINNENDISQGVVIERENIIEVDSNNPPKVNHKKKQKIEDDKVLIPEIVEDKEQLEHFDLKAQLSPKELRFIELYLTVDHKIETVMKLAGYNEYSQSYLPKLASKIIQKYECQAGDHRKIMRAMGYGEVKILQLLIDSATKAKSETVKLNARIALAKCVGVQKEVLEGVEGVTIIFNAPARPPEQPTTTQPGQLGALPAPTTKTRMIK